jgi:hypothetical protein
MKAKVDVVTWRGRRLDALNQEDLLQAAGEFAAAADQIPAATLAGIEDYEAAALFARECAAFAEYAARYSEWLRLASHEQPADHARHRCDDARLAAPTALCIRDTCRRATEARRARVAAQAAETADRAQRMKPLDRVEAENITAAAEQATAAAQQAEADLVARVAASVGRQS